MLSLEGMKKIVTFALLALTLTACNYSNTFQGTYNDSPASMTAYSRNINRYCIALNLTSGAMKKSSYISASLLFDPNDFLRPTVFNSKGSNCGAGLSEYLEGARSTQVLGTSIVYRSENYGFDYCRYVYYQQYRYKEEVRIHFKNNSDDQLVGSFVGMGEVSEYVDFDHPVNYGPIYYCGPYRPYPPYVLIH
jgi:hypothetical protein